MTFKVRKRTIYPQIIEFNCASNLFALDYSGNMILLCLIFAIIFTKISENHSKPFYIKHT
jgi:hypothetical protein